MSRRVVAVRGSSGLEPFIGIGLAIALIVASGHHLSLKGAAAGQPASVTAVNAHGVAPAGSSYTPQTWAAAFLGYGGFQQTGCDLAAVEAWESAEGGQWGPNPRDDGTYNPLNTTRPEPGSSGVISTGTPGVYVQGYPSWREGFQGTLAVLDNGLYGAVIAALRAGDSAQAVADAVASSPWGTKPFQASC